MNRDDNQDVVSKPFGKEVLIQNAGTNRRFRTLEPTLELADHLALDTTTKAVYWADSLLDSIKVFKVREAFDVERSIVYMKQLHHSCITGNTMVRFEHYMSYFMVYGPLLSDIERPFEFGFVYPFTEASLEDIVVTGESLMSNPTVNPSNFRAAHKST